MSYGDYDYDNDCNSNDFQPMDAALKIIITQSLERGQITGIIIRENNFQKAPEAA